MRVLAWVVVVAVAGCQRITVDVPDAGAGPRIDPDSVSGPCQFSLCGASVAVKTSLAPGTALTNEECTRVCASAWCGLRPISPAPGCTLTTATSVSCGATAYDCGYCVFGCGTDPSRCGAGCCDLASNCCKDTLPSCRGLSCGSCPPIDARCSLEACRSFAACGGRLAAEPRAAVCGDASDAGIDLAEFCPGACNAMGAGAQLEAGCTDGGVGLDAGSPSPDGGACDCEAKRATCEGACAQTSVRTCLDCAAGCGIEFARCSSACR